MEPDPDMGNKWTRLDLGPKDPVSRAVRSLRVRLPRLFWLVTLLPRLLMGKIYARRVARLGLGHPLNELDSPGLKTSDTVFVLATGASINRYDEDRWKVIAKHDSIGMNWFMLHDFVPDLYVMENMGDRHRGLLAMRAEDYADVPIILKSHLTNVSPRRLRDRIDKLEQNPPHVRDRFYLSLDLEAPGDDVRQTYDAYRLMRRAGLFATRPRFMMLSKRRGSVTYIINLAVRMGYRRIVLCGVDLNHGEYFYDSRRDDLEARGFPVPENLNPGPVHMTNDPRKHPVTVQDVITVINDVVLEPAGIELSVGDRSSALYPEFPEYQWEDA